MKRPRCQRENPPHLKFCLECATPLALRCWKCETQLIAGAMCFEYTSVRGPGRPVLLADHCHLGLGQLHAGTSKHQAGAGEPRRCNNIPRDRHRFWLEQEDGVRADGD